MPDTLPTATGINFALPRRKKKKEIGCNDSRTFEPTSLRLGRCLKRRFVANRNVGLRGETCLKPADGASLTANNKKSESMAFTTGSG